MESSSGMMNIKEGNMNASNSCSGNNNSIGGRDNSSPTSFQRNQVSMDWTLEEQALLEEGLVKYASETSISRYAKIAISLKNKTVRDVALRCKWTSQLDVLGLLTGLPRGLVGPLLLGCTAACWTAERPSWATAAGLHCYLLYSTDIHKKENSKRRKDDANLLKKNKDRKEKMTDPTAVSSPVVMQPVGYAPYAQGVVSNKSEGFASYHATSVTTQLIHQNARIFEQISAKLVTHQIHENTRLLCQARDNIFKILTNLNESSCALRQMPPLPVKLNEELANSILPPSTHALG